MSDGAVAAGVIVGFMGGMLFALMLAWIADNTYYDGQVDCLTGVIKYELVTLPDSTREWKAK